MSNAQKSAGRKRRRTGAAEIAAALRAELADGALRAGASLPPVDDLRRLFGAGEFAVRHALQLLRDEGLTPEEIKNKTGLHEFRVKTYAAAVQNKKTSRLEGALRLCMEADMQIKVSSLDDYTVLDRLVVRLCRV